MPSRIVLLKLSDVKYHKDIFPMSNVSSSKYFYCFYCITSYEKNNNEQY